MSDWLDDALKDWPDSNEYGEILEWHDKYAGSIKRMLEVDKKEEIFTWANSHGFYPVDSEINDLIWQLYPQPVVQNQT